MLHYSSLEIASYSESLLHTSFDLNDYKEVVGLIGLNIGVYWNKARGEEILIDDNAFDSFPYAINNHRQIIVNYLNQIYLIKEDQFTVIPNFIQGDYIESCSINENGNIVGYLNTKTGNMFHAFIWFSESNKYCIIHPSGNRTKALAINNNNQVVGHVEEWDTNNYYGFLWQHNDLIDLKDFIPFDINDKGYIIGLKNDNILVLYKNKEVIDLYHFDQVKYLNPKRINNHNIIIGSYDQGDFFQRSAFVLLDKQLLDLNEITTINKNIKLLDAIAINDEGCILCSATNNKTYLLCPDQK